jgi:cytochrome b involved in lipid metabolism
MHKASKQQQPQQMTPTLNPSTASSTTDAVAPHRKRTITREEVAKHNKDGDLWVVLDGMVLDVSEFQFCHPGGRLVLHESAGQDVSNSYRNAGHSKRARKVVERLKIGNVPDEATPIRNCHLGAAAGDSKWREFFVFVLSFVATAITVFSYWSLICNREAEIETFSELVTEIMTTNYIPTQIFLGSFIVADFLLLKESRKNFARVQRAGFSYTYIVFCMSSIYFLSAPTLGVIFWLLLQDSPVYFSFPLVLKIIADYLASDVLFFENVHKWLHHHKPEWHLMHHICRYPTATSPLIMEFQDYVLEFWASKFPIILVFGTDVFGTYDGFVCVSALTFAILIDVCNHDPWCRTPHYDHHVDISSSYGVVPIRLAPPKTDQFDRLHALLDSALLASKPPTLRSQKSFTLPVGSPETRRYQKSFTLPVCS